MIKHTIQGFAVLMSEGGLGNYVIVDLAKTATDALVPDGLPHGVGDIVGTEKTAIEFMVDEADDDNHAGDAYRQIVQACQKHADVMQGTITLVVDGEVETTSIG